MFYYTMRKYTNTKQLYSKFKRVILVLIDLFPKRPSTSHHVPMRAQLASNPTLSHPVLLSINIAIITGTSQETKTVL